MTAERSAAIVFLNRGRFFEVNLGINSAAIWTRVGTRSAFPWFEIISGGLGKLVGPSVDDGMAIDVVDAGHDALLEFVL